MNRTPFVSFLKTAVCALMLAGAAATLHAADAAGSWVWTTPGRNGGPDRTNTLTLKIEDTKVTGKLSTPGRNGRANETDISEGKVDGDNVSFSVTRQGRNGNSMTTKYSGKVSGDAITGKMEFTRNDEPATRDWKAKRSTGSSDSK